MEILDQLFGPGEHITGAQQCARTVLVFAYGLLLLRLGGRRLFGRWSALDIVVSIMIGSNLSRALTGNAPLWGTLAATTLLVGLHWLAAQGTARSRLLSRIVEGGPVRLGRGGSHDPGILARHGVSVADLNEALRQSGLEDTSGAREITLEPSGKITVLKAS